MKPIQKFVLIVLLVAALGHSSCKKEPSCEGCRENNKPPIAVAGPDQVITLPTDSVVLDGRTSSDPDGMISSYLWTKISGPASFTITKPTDSTTKIKALVTGTYQFELKVTDNGGLSAKDTMQVRVNGSSTSEAVYITGCNASLTTFGHLSSPANGTQVISASSKIFFFWYDGNSSGTNVYDTISRTWTTTSQWVGDINIGIKLMGATYTYPVDIERFQVYDALSGSVNMHEVPEARAFIQHDITGNKVIFAGGFYPDYSIPGASKRIDIYDNASNSWSLVNYDSASRSTGIAAFDNKIFLFGSYIRVRLDILICGFDDDGTYYCYNPSYADTKMDIYDISTKIWSVKYLSEAKGNIRIAKLGNKLYFFQSYSQVIDVYDATTNKWTAEIKNDESDWSRIHVVGDKILLTKFWSNQVGVYDVTTHAWSIKQLARPNAQTDYLVAIVGNKALFFYVFDYEDRSTAIDTYDATTNTWCHGELSRSLLRSAIGVAGNKIYIAGGTTRTNPNGTYNQFLDNIWIFNF